MWMEKEHTHTHTKFFFRHVPLNYLWLYFFYFLLPFLRCVSLPSGWQPVTTPGMWSLSQWDSHCCKPGSLPNRWRSSKSQRPLALMMMWVEFGAELFRREWERCLMGSGVCMSWFLGRAVQERTRETFCGKWCMHIWVKHCLTAGLAAGHKDTNWCWWWWCELIWASSCWGDTIVIIGEMVYMWVTALVRTGADDDDVSWFGLLAVEELQQLW